MGRYKTVNLYVSTCNFKIEIEVVKAVLKHMGGAAYIKPDFPAAVRSERGPWTFVLLQTPVSTLYKRSISIWPKSAEPSRAAHPGLLETTTDGK